MQKIFFCASKGTSQSDNCTQCKPALKWCINYDVNHSKLGHFLNVEKIFFCASKGTILERLSPQCKPAFRHKLMNHKPVFWLLSTCFRLATTSGMTASMRLKHSIDLSRPSSPLAISASTYNSPFWMMLIKALKFVESFNCKIGINRFESET